MLYLQMCTERYISIYKCMVFMVFKIKNKHHSVSRLLKYLHIFIYSYSHYIYKKTCVYYIHIPFHIDLYIYSQSLIYI